MSLCAPLWFVFMRHHEYSIELPYAAARLWALFQRYDLWKEYAPAVLDVEIVYPGDATGNGTPDATANSDYSSLTTVLTFTAGQTAQTVSTRISCQSKSGTAL